MTAGPLRVVFMGTPDFAVPSLSALAASQNISIVGVYCQPDRPSGRGLETIPPPVKKKAIDLGFSAMIRQPQRLSDPGEFEALQAMRPDVIVVVAFGQILKKNVLDLPRLGCVNVHSSLLPRWRGAAPIHHAVLAGDAETGVTTMKLVEKLDAGDILLVAKTAIGKTERVGELHDRLAIMGADLVVPTLEGLADGTLRGQVQDDSQVTYASKLTKEMELLDSKLSAEVLGRRVRALNPWPGTSVHVLVGSSTQRLKIRRAQPHPGLKGKPGFIFEQAGMVLLGTAEGSLELLELQWEGKKASDAAAFLNGLRGRGQSLPLELSSTQS